MISSDAVDYGVDDCDFEDDLEADLSFEDCSEYCSGE